MRTARMYALVTVVTPSTPSPARLVPPSNVKVHSRRFGPGLVVMLADTDAGSVVTAGPSGAEWGYHLLLLYFALLLPIVLGFLSRSRSARCRKASRSAVPIMRWCSRSPA